MAAWRKRNWESFSGAIEALDPNSLINEIADASSGTMHLLPG